MTCAETREQFSARADDALSVAERAALDAHLAGCAECRREWQRFAATVGLLRAVEPARAPAGFVDRVLAGARPEPWYRRVARGLLMPWPVKLPLEAAAVVMVAGLAVLIFQRSSELQRMAVPPETMIATPGETKMSELEARTDKNVVARPAGPPPRAMADAPRGQDAGAPAPERQDETALAVRSSRDARESRAKADEGRLESAPPPVAQQQADEPALARRQQSAQQPAESTTHYGLQPPQVAATAPPAPPAAASAAPPAKSAPGFQGYSSEGAAKDTGMAQGLVRGARERKTEDAEAQVKKLAARTVPANVELRLTVGDRAAAEVMVGTMVERLGGAVVPGAAPGTLEIMVPRDAFPALTADLGRLGTLRTLRQPAELPENVRISLQLAN